MIIGHLVDVNKKIQAIFTEFLNVIDISFTFQPSSKNSEHKLCQTPRKDVNITRFKHARAKRSINKLSIIPLVTWLFLAVILKSKIFFAKSHPEKAGNRICGTLDFKIFPRNPLEWLAPSALAFCPPPKL